MIVTIIGGPMDSQRIEVEDSQRSIVMSRLTAEQRYFQAEVDDNLIAPVQEVRCPIHMAPSGQGFIVWEEAK